MIEFEALPELEDPVLVAAFEGWNDAGDAASDAIDHLRDVWGAQPLAEMDPEDYYDYQVNRPTIAFDDSGVRRLTWPTTRLYVARLPLATRDVVLVHGIEPNMRWRQFTDELLGLCAELGVSMAVTLGALLSDSPHTRPVPVTGTATDSGTARRLGVEPSHYEGPTGIVGVLQDACARRSLPSVSLWAAVPHYVAQSPSPKATLALVRRVEDLLDVPVPLGDLVEDSRAWELGVDELAAEDEEVADYVRQLEEARDTTDLPEASGEAIAREFERYLRRRGSDDS
ncbi:MAG: PAC2 family protein [Actinomycetales bacterium]|nr:PAC2 family protein [Actinomycetales bacterium]